MTNSNQLQSEFQTDSFTKLIAISINSFHRYIEFDLNSILRAIVFPFVFIIVSIQYLHDIIYTFKFELPAITYPKPFVHPTLLINNQLQSVTVKNLRLIKSFPKSYKKQDIIEALLIN